MRRVAPGWAESSPSGSRLTESLRAAGVATVLVRANHPDTDAPDWYYAGWDEVFDARPQEEDKFAARRAAVAALPAVLERLSAKPDFLLWIEIDRLLPPWEIRQEVFEAYLEHEEEEQPEANEDEADEEEEDDEDEANEEESGQEQGDDEAEEPPAPDEPVTPWRDPPTGPFDASDPDAREWLAISFGALVSILDAELGALFDLFALAGSTNPPRGFSRPTSAIRSANTVRSACIARGCTRNSSTFRSSFGCPVRRRRAGACSDSRNRRMCSSRYSTCSA